MDSTIWIWAIGAAIVILIAMLIVVSMARHMDRGARPSSAPATPPTTGKTTRPGTHSDAKASLDSLVQLTSIEGLIAAANTERPAGKQPSSDAKNLSAGMSVVVAAIAIIGAVAAIASDAFGASDPPVESEISAGALQGTLLDAGRKSEIVLIVPGSGPTDRNGDNPMGVKAQPYRLLAEDLAADGISTVRVDKRGMFGSAGAGNPNEVSVEIYASDYRAWVDAIRAQTGAKCVWLLGHSEGALMVSAAAEGRKDVCGLILVSGMGRKMGDVIRAQLQANPANAPVMDSALNALSELEAGRRVDTTGMHPALLPLFAPAVQDYLIDILPTDPVEVLRRAKKQALIVQGTTDLQTTVEDAKLLDKARRTQLELVKGMNHVLKEAPLDRAANIATYGDPDLPLADGLVKEIRNFIEDDD